MSQTTVPSRRPASPYASPPPAVPARRTARATQAVRTGLHGTPGRLRLLAAATVVVGLLVGVVGLQAFRSMDGALDRADANAQQLVRLQSVSIALVRADADATGAFLVGGLEPAAERTDYLSAVDTATRQITAAARSQPADATALAELNSDLTTYVGLVEQARAGNRQALPVGGQYLRDAGAGLRADALPVLQALVAANTHRVEVELDHAGGAIAVLVVVLLLALVVLGAAMLWLARRTHRYLNVGLAAAASVLLVALVAGTATLAGANGRAQDVRKGPYATALALSTARTAAFDAKSNESLTLIARGSGAAFEKVWAASSQRTQDQLAKAGDAGLSDAWRAYASTHQKVRELDDAGSSDEAVALATDAKAPTSSGATFGAFDEASATALASESRVTSSSLTDARSALQVGGWLMLLAGLVAAVLAWWGVSKRLEEYR